MKRIPSSLTVLAISVAAASTSASEPFHAAESAVKFTARGVAGLKITGETSRLGLKEQGNALTFEAPTTDFKTGIGLRDKHLKEHLDAEKFPAAKLVVDRSKITLPNAAGPTSATATADFTLHGVTHPVKIHYRLERSGDGYKAHGDFEVTLPDYGITKPCYMGICVDEHVGVEADFKVQGG